jgi:16S rRNA (cytosine967-C5)-methyltransferase
VDPARRAAYEVLRGVSRDDAYANLLLPARLHAHGLSGRDAAFATELVSGTLRRAGTYDEVIAAGARRPVERIDPAVLDALRLGAHQLLAMRVPPHAAVDTTVSLVRAEVGQSAVGFANAVLRRVGEAEWGEWLRRLAPDPREDELGFAALAHAHPRWVVEAFVEALGDRADELDALLAADNAPPRVTLVARPGFVTREQLLGQVALGEPTPWSPYGVVMGSGDPGDVAAVAAGAAGVQDEGSQLVALAAVAGRVLPDRLWLDACAGPGGKAALLAATARERGAHLVAAERVEHRAALVSRAVASAGGSASVVVADGTRPPWRDATFDRALVDAPCTGLGALRRRPEARWRRSPDDLPGLTRLQHDLLDRAVDVTRPGGMVTYATCSPVIAETADVVRRLLAERDDVALEDAGPVLENTIGGEPADAMGPLPGTLQLWPHRHGTDAMFVALLRRTR